MVTQLPRLRLDLHNKLLAVRSLDRLVHSELFERAYAAAGEEARAVVSERVRAGERQRVVEWIANVLRSSLLLEELPVTQLRDLAADCCVRGYRVMTKQGLISAIRRYSSDERRAHPEAAGAPRGDAGADPGCRGVREEV